MNVSFDQLIKELSESGPVILLESQSVDHPASKVSYLAACPKATIKAKGASIRVDHPWGQQSKSISQANPWEALRQFRNTYNDWMFGYLGYDLKNYIEDLYSCNNDSIGAPDLFFMVPDLLIRFDPDMESMKLLKGNVHPTLNQADTFTGPVSVKALNSSMNKETYIAQIRKAQQEIKDGDFYEINLSRQLSAGFNGRPFHLYSRMRNIGPVPFGAFMTFDDISVCSLSPERFLKKEGRHVFSQPIKGTIKRGKTPKEDQLLKDQLSHSVKNRAENLMIVDLVRNDLSRIAQRGSVTVSELFQIQSFGTVHQMVSTIEAESIVDDPVEIIRAGYPMGSMTGAPKISAMKTIEQLENYRRGIYSGAIGYFRPDDDFDFNVVIRTAIIKNDKLFYSVGGAITSDSDPEEEWEETIVKTHALTSVF